MVWAMTRASSALRMMGFVSDPTYYRFANRLDETAIALGVMAAAMFDAGGH
jgi:hypothetical protein